MALWRHVNPACSSTLGTHVAWDILNAWPQGCIGSVFFASAWGFGSMLHTAPDSPAVCAQGMSPALAKDLVGAAGLSSQATPGDLTEAQWADLYCQWRGWLERLASGSFQARACSTSEHTSVLGLGGGQEFASCMEAVDSYYRDRQVGGMILGCSICRAA